MTLRPVFGPHRYLYMLRGNFAFQLGLPAQPSVQRTWSVLAVTLNFDFLLIVCVRTVVAAIGFESGNLTLTRRVCAFAPATYVDDFCHNAPRVSEFPAITQPLNRLFAIEPIQGN